MNEFIEMLIGRLEEYTEYDIFDIYKEEPLINISFETLDDIVNQLAEEYNNELVKGDLISKKAVITELNGIYLDNPWDDKEDILEKAIGIVDHFPTAYNNGWIPCSERLPEKDMWCLATFESGNVDKIQYLASQKWWNGEMGDNRVIAWQPLPAPYQPKVE